MLALGRAGETFITVSVGAFFPHQAPRLASGDTSLVRGLVGPAGAFVGAGADERLGHGRAVKGAVDHDRPLAVGLAAELSHLVVHHERITQRPHRQVEPLGERLGVTAVGAHEPGRPTAPAHPGQQAAAGAARVLAGPAEHDAQGQVGVGGDVPRRPPHGHDGGFQGQVDLPQRLALGPGPVPAVGFSHVPAPVGVAGSGAPARRRPP